MQTCGELSPVSSGVDVEGEGWLETDVGDQVGFSVIAGPLDSTRLVLPGWSDQQASDGTSSHPRRRSTARPCSCCAVT